MKKEQYSTELFHLGNNDWFLNKMPPPNLYNYYKERTKKGLLLSYGKYLKNLIKDYEARSICAITANDGQKELAPILISNGFKPSVTFYSAHNSFEETLTLWVRLDKKKSKVNKSKSTMIKESKIVTSKMKLDFNCSVSVNRYNTRFSILTDGNGGGVKIPGTSLSYHIGKEFDEDEEFLETFHSKEARKGLGLDF